MWIPLQIIWLYGFLKVSEYPFKQNKNTLKNIKVLLYTHFYNISFNILRPTFFNITNLPFSHFPNIKKIRVKVGPKTNYFSYIMSSCNDRVAVFNNFFHWYLANQETNKTVPAIFLFSNIFWIIYMQNLFSCKIRFQSQLNYCNKKWMTHY